MHNCNAAILLSVLIVAPCKSCSISLDYPPSCLNATEIPPLLVPPPPKILAVEGQTVTVTATYKGAYDSDDLQAFWNVHTSKAHLSISPGHPQQGYNATIKECPIDFPNCCKFQTSIVLESVTLNQSGAELKSKACRSYDCTKYEQGNSNISKDLVYYVIYIYIIISQ